MDIPLLGHGKGVECVGKTIVVATRITNEELDQLDKALAGPLKGAYRNRSEFLRSIMLVALKRLERSV